MISPQENPFIWPLIGVLTSFITIVGAYLVSASSKLALFKGTSGILGVYSVAATTMTLFLFQVIWTHWHSKYATFYYNISIQQHSNRCHKPWIFPNFFANIVAQYNVFLLTYCIDIFFGTLQPATSNQLVSTSRWPHPLWPLFRTCRWSPSCKTTSTSRWIWMTILIVFVCFNCISKLYLRIGRVLNCINIQR